MKLFAQSWRDQPGNPLPGAEYNRSACSATAPDYVRRVATPIKPDPHRAPCVKELDVRYRPKAQKEFLARAKCLAGRLNQWELGGRD